MSKRSFLRTSTEHSGKVPEVKVGLCRLEQLGPPGTQEEVAQVPAPCSSWDPGFPLPEVPYAGSGDPGGLQRSGLEHRDTRGDHVAAPNVTLSSPKQSSGLLCLGCLIFSGFIWGRGGGKSPEKKLKAS